MQTWFLEKAVFTGSSFFEAMPWYDAVIDNLLSPSPARLKQSAAISGVIAFVSVTSPKPLGSIMRLAGFALNPCSFKSKPMSRGKGDSLAMRTFFSSLGLSKLKEKLASGVSMLHSSSRVFCWKSVSICRGTRCSFKNPPTLKTKTA